MSIFRYLLLFGIQAGVVFGMVSKAHALGGEITFSGAIVAPTCNIATIPEQVLLTLSARPPGTPLPSTCANKLEFSSTYTLAIISLGSAEPDSLLSYFSAYVRASGTGLHKPVLVTQTYD